MNDLARIQNSDGLLSACVALTTQVATLKDPRQDPAIFDVISRALTTGDKIAPAIWRIHLDAVDTLARQTASLGPDIAHAGKVISAAVQDYPAELDRDGRFFFMASYLATALHEIWCNASPQNRNLVPLKIARDLIFAPLQGKIVYLQGIQDAPPGTAWPGTATYPPEHSVHVNMMLAHVDIALVPDMDDAAGDACIALARQIRRFLVDPVHLDSPGSLLTKDDFRRPVDLQWAKRPNGQKFLNDMKNTFPDRIWPEYRDA